MNAFDQARRYLDAIPGAVAGQAGHNQTFTVAMVLVEGFALGREDATNLMREYSARCQPPWSDSEIAHKVESALGKMDAVKRGNKVNQGQANQDYQRPHTVAKPAPAPAPVTYDLPPDVMLPAPMTQSARQLLQAAFQPGEGVRIAQARTGDDGREVPKNAGNTLPLEQWLEKLEAVQGNPNGIMSTSERNGIFVSVNPMKPGGTKDSDVTDYRHALLEFDAIPKEEQWAVIQASGVPCTAVISSGGKSLHAWVRVDAKDMADYKAKVNALYQHFAAYKPDEKNKNPSRFSRLPGCERGDSRQELLALNPTPIFFDSWMQSKAAVTTDALPAIDNAETMLHEDMTLPPEIICGVLHQSCKAIFGGSSKARKTWILTDLAVSVSAGIPFWRWPTIHGRVLVINFEIPRAFIRSRIRAVAEAKQVADLSMLDVWTLRGHAAPLSRLLPELVSRVKDNAYSLIIIDPIYKLLGGRDENSAGDIGELCNEIERLAIEANAGIVFGAHYSKGNQAGKTAMDRISGSGAFARDADSIITLTNHAEADCYSIEATLRNHREQSPFVVRWQFPLMVVDDKLDARQLKRPEPKQEKAEPANTDEDLLAGLEGTTPEQAMTLKEWAEKVKVSRATLGRRKTALREAGYVASVGEGTAAKTYITEKGKGKI